MRIRSIYFVISAVLVVLLFSVQPYSVLFDTIVLHPPASYADQFSRLGEQERRVFRYGKSYSFYLLAEQALEQAHIADPVILLPPQRYLDEMGVKDISMVEPSEFYYYTGHKAVWANSPGTGQARWTFAPQKPDVVLKQIESPAMLDQLLKLYRPYLERK